MKESWIIPAKREVEDEVEKHVPKHVTGSINGFKPLIGKISESSFARLKIVT